MSESSEAPNAKTRVFALLGDPVAHSLSPRLHNAAFEAHGLNAVYVALRCDGEALRGLLCGIALAGGGGNVTIPHKEAAAALLERASDAVRKTGACNTFWCEKDRVCGDNTDVAGFQRAAGQLIGSLASTRVLVLGAGGGARAVVHALLRNGVDEIRLANRTPERIAALVEWFDDRRIRALDTRDSGRFDLVVNATPLGLGSEDELPLADATLDRCGAAMDLLYPGGETALMRAARLRGVPSADGLQMLVEQAALSFSRWYDVRPPIAVMQRAAGVEGATD